MPACSAGDTKIMATKSECIICNEGASTTRKLVSNPFMIEDLLNCCKEKVALGQNNLETLVSNLEGLSEREKTQVQYHSECRKPILSYAESTLQQFRQRSGGQMSVHNFCGCDNSKSSERILIKFSGKVRNGPRTT